MKPPASIKPHLSVEQMFKWLQQANDKSSHKRRMAIWLIYTGRLNAPKVAEILGVSVQAIWLWTNQYNRHGPKGLERKGRGGRRWAFLSRETEAEILKPFIAHAKTGNIAKASEIKPFIEKRLNRRVSMPYVYKLLARHGWSHIIAQSRKIQKPILSDDFTTISRPWLRKQ